MISEPHVHLQTMNKTSAQFQNGQTKILGGATLTKNPHNAE